MVAEAQTVLKMETIVIINKRVVCLDGVSHDQLHIGQVVISDGAVNLASQPAPEPALTAGTPGLMGDLRRLGHHAVWDICLTNPINIDPRVVCLVFPMTMLTVIYGQI